MTAKQQLFFCGFICLNVKTIQLNMQILRIFFHRFLFYGQDCIVCPTSSENPHYVFSTKQTQLVITQPVTAFSS